MLTYIAQLWENVTDVTSLSVSYVCAKPSRFIRGL
jgi:hypothetical protein